MQSNLSGDPLLTKIFPKHLVLFALAAWATFFVVVYVRWLTRVQGWTWDILTMAEFWKRSHSMFYVIVSLGLILIVLVAEFTIPPDLIVYGSSVSILWPVASFLATTYPWGER